MSRRKRQPVAGGSASTETTTTPPQAPLRRPVAQNPPSARNKKTKRGERHKDSRLPEATTTPGAKTTTIPDMIPQTPAQMMPSPGTSQQKVTRTRKNPARRRSEAQVKANNPPQSIKPASATIPNALKRQPRKLDRLNTQDLPRPRKKPVLPTPKTRFNTAGRRNSLVSLASSDSSSDRSTNSLGIFVPAVVTGGLMGCAAGAAILACVCVYYDFSGVKSAILTARSAKLCVDNLTDEMIASLKAGTYNPDEALDMLRRTTLAYAGAVPDGTAFVERLFREIDLVRKERGPEVEKVMQEAFGELASASNRNIGVDEMSNLVTKHLVKLAVFAGNAVQDIVGRNPRLKPFKNGAIKSLRGPPPPKVPTLKVNMTMKQKQAAAA